MNVCSVFIFVGVFVFVVGQPMWSCFDTASGTHCICPDGYMATLHGCTKLVLEYGDSCSGRSCPDNLVCRGQICVCPVDQYYHLGCKPKSNYRGQCSSSLPCKDTLTCENGVCGCTDIQFFESTCKPKRDHTVECDPTISNVCSDPENVCIPDITGKHRCLCDVSDYSRSDDCHPLNELQVINFQVQKNDPPQVRLTWTANDYGLPVNYKIEWTSRKDLSDKGEKTAGKDGVMVSDLTPGRQYTFFITSKLSGDTYYPEKFTRVEQTVDMLPAQPGPIDLVTSQLESPPYSLIFQPSDGDVAKYKITLTVDGNPTFREVIEVVKPRVENLDLLPGRVYTYTIIAFNERGEITEPVLGSFRAGPLSDDNDDDEYNNNLPIVIGAAGAALTLVAIIIVIIVILMRRRRRKTHNKKSSKQDAQLAQKNTNIYATYASNGYIEPYDKQYEENVYNEAYEDGCRIYFNSHSNAEEEGTAEYDKEPKKLEHGSYENEI